jgi:hypothetical protein
MARNVDDDLNRGFDAGNYANAYETHDYDHAIACLSMNRSEAYIDAFTLGFFSSYEVDEMGEHADTYIAVWCGPNGRRCKEIGIALPDSLTSEENE